MNNSKNLFNRFLLLWSGEFISAIGSGLTSFGLGVYVFEQTGKASATAIVMLLAFLPTLILSAPAGVLADRYDRRLLMIAGDGLSALGLVFILLCMFNGGAKLWQICLGVAISSIFSSLLEPAYRATITDLLTEDQYTKASGLVQLAGSARYLISPLLAGFLLAVSDIKLLLVMDICTLFVTIASTLVVRKGLVSKPSEKAKSFIDEFRDGWYAVSKNKGVLTLVVFGSVLTFFLGFIQTLSTPMVLAFTDSKALGTTLTISAMGMLLSSLLIGFIPIKKGYVNILSISLFFAGIFMAVFGLRENIIIIGISGFLFFATLPFANTCLDYLVRTNIENEYQGRAWGLIGVISQIGYVVAYGVSGILADAVFTPMLAEGGVLVGSVGKFMGIGNGRGIGLLILTAGLMLSIASIILKNIQSVKGLEKEGVSCTAK